MRYLLPGLLALCQLIGCGQPRGITVAAAVPAVEALLKELTRNSTIQVVTPIPADLSLEEHHQFFDEHAPLLDSLASRVSAVVTIRSVLPEDMLYPELRERNIRTVEIDCATPLNDHLTGVALLRDSTGVNPCIWLSISNAMKMAELAGKDLVRLSPADSAVIVDNLKKIKQRYFALKSDHESRFSQVENFTAASMDRAYDYLLNDIGLYVTHRFPADENEWTPRQFAAFKAALASRNVGTLVCSWTPTSEVGALCRKNSLQTAVLVKGAIGTQYSSEGLYGLLERNLSSLQAALNPSRP